MLGMTLLTFAAIEINNYAQLYTHLDMRLLNQSLTEYVFIMIDLNEVFNFMLT